MALIEAFHDWLGRQARARATAALDRANPRPIASFVAGNRECIQGNIVPPDELLRSPLTGTPCVCWMLELAEDIGSDVVERRACARSCPFLMEDSTGSARVAAERPIVFAPLHRIDRSSRIGGARSPAVARCIAEFGSGFRFLCRQATLEIREYYLEPERAVKVLGICTREPDPGGAADVTGYRDALPTRPVLSGSRRSPLVIGAFPAPEVSGAFPAP